MKQRNGLLLQILKKIILSGTVSTQEEIRNQLMKQGFTVNQSKISRLLRKITAIKIETAAGKIVYQIPKETTPALGKKSLSNLIFDICANETLIIVKTSPGSAPLIARMLDYQPLTSSILATLAGDDTVFIAPKSIHQIDKTLEEIRKLLSHLLTNE